jgi:hypothetical protein
VARKWKPVVLSTIDDVIAEDWWEIRHRGRRLTAHIAVGRAAPDPSGQDWYCPVLMEGLPAGWAEMKGWKPIYGVGPVDSTMNAFTLIWRAFHEFGPAPASRPKPTARRARSKK